VPTAGSCGPHRSRLLLCSTREGGRLALRELLDAARGASASAPSTRGTTREGDGEEHLRRGVGLYFSEERRVGRAHAREREGTTARARGIPRCGAWDGRVSERE